MKNTLKNIALTAGLLVLIGCERKPNLTQDNFKFDEYKSYELPQFNRVRFIDLDNNGKIDVVVSRAATVESARFVLAYDNSVSNLLSKNFDEVNYSRAVKMTPEMRDAFTIGVSNLNEGAYLMAKEKGWIK